jgi:hypothetical protein
MCRRGNVQASLLFLHPSLSHYPSHIRVISESYPSHIRVISESFPSHIRVISESYPSHIRVPTDPARRRRQVWMRALESAGSPAGLA